MRNILERLITTISSSNLGMLMDCVSQKKYKLKPYVKPADLPSAVTVGRVTVHFIQGDKQNRPDIICTPDIGVGGDYIRLWRQTGIGNLMTDWKKNRLTDDKNNPLYHELTVTSNGEKYNALVRLLNDDVKDVCLDKNDISLGVGRAVIDIEDKKYLVIREKSVSESWVSKYKTFDMETPEDSESHITTFETTRADFSQLF